jgi:hypothetical protein
VVFFCNMQYEFTDQECVRKVDFLVASLMLIFTSVGTKK